MNTIDQANGLWVASRMKRLQAQDWLNEDEAWELYQLEIEAGLRDRPDPSPPSTAFVANLWADEIVETFKTNLIMGAYIDAGRQ